MYVCEINSLHRTQMVCATHTMMTNLRWRQMWQNLRGNHQHMRFHTSHPYHLPLDLDWTPIPLDPPTLLPPLVLSPPTLSLRPESPNPSFLVTPDPLPFALSLIQALLCETATGPTTLQHNEAGDVLAIKELPTWLLGELLSSEDWRWCLGQGPNPNLSPFPASWNPYPFLLTATNVTPMSTFWPNCPLYQCPYWCRCTPGHPQQACPNHVCALSRERGYVDIHCPDVAVVTIPGPSNGWTWEAAGSTWVGVLRIWRR